MGKHSSSNSWQPVIISLVPLGEEAEKVITGANKETWLSLPMYSRSVMKAFFHWRMARGNAKTSVHNKYFCPWIHTSTNYTHHWPNTVYSFCLPAPSHQSLQSWERQIKKEQLVQPGDVEGCREKEHELGRYSKEKRQDGITGECLP